MTGRALPAGARDNGLPAAAYVPVADVSPVVADALLDALRAEGVAAYAVPVGMRAVGELAAAPYRRPQDRVHADAAASARARALVDTLLPHLLPDLLPDTFPSPGPVGPGQVDVDAAWAQIVANYGAPDPTERVLRSPDAAAPGVPHTAPPAPPGHDDAADHYVPPPPPPLPRGDAPARLAWAAFAGGPAYFFLAALLGWHVSRGAALLAVLAFIGGFVALVARMKDRPPVDDGPDDGAVV